MPYSARPHEVIQCRKFDDALAIAALKPSEGQVTDEATTLLQDLLKDKFECKEDLVERLKKLTLLTVSVPHSNVLLIWTDVAKSIKLQDAEGLNVYKTDSDDYLILLRKRDYRGAQGLLQLPGFIKRYVGSKTHAANDIQLTGLTMSVLRACKGMHCICTLFRHDFSRQSPLDVVAACRDMNPTTLLYYRLEAQMTPDKKKDELQRALCSGWGTIEKLIKGSGSNKLRDTVRLATDEWIPKLSSYKNFTSLKWGCFHVECEYYDTDRESMLPVTLTSIMNDTKHLASYRNAASFSRGRREMAKLIWPDPWHE